jgi:hypothetical protein
VSNYVSELDDNENTKKEEEEKYNILPKVLPTNILKDHIQ